MNDLGILLNQINKFSGIPAKFGATPNSRLVTIGFNLDVNAFPDYHNDLNVYADTLTSFLATAGWDINSVSRFDQNGAAGILISANVGNQYTLAQVQSSITDLLVNQLGWSLYGDIQIQGNEGGTVSTVVNTPPKPPGTIIKVNPPIPTPTLTPTPNQMPKPTTQPTSNWFTDLIMDDNGKLSTAGWAVIATLGVVTLAMVAQKK